MSMNTNIPVKPDYQANLCVEELGLDEYFETFEEKQWTNFNSRDDRSEKVTRDIIQEAKRLISFTEDRGRCGRNFLLPYKNAEEMLMNPQKWLKEDILPSAKNDIEGRASLQSHLSSKKSKPELDIIDVDVHARLKNKVRYALLKKFLTYIRQIYRMRKETGIDTVVFTPQPSIWRKDLCSFEIRESVGIPVERLSPESEELDTKIEDMDKYLSALLCEKGLYRYDDIFWYFYISRDDGPVKMHLLFSVQALEAADVERLLAQETTV